MNKTYSTFRIRVANDARVQVEKWDAEHHDLGQPSGVLRYQENLAEITPLLQSVSNGDLKTAKQARALGEALFNTLFDDRLGQKFIDFYYEVVQKGKQLLRVELDIDERELPEVAALPWEFMCLPERENLGELWLGTDPNLVFARRRSQWNPAEPIQLKPGEKLRIALAIAAPRGLNSVKYEEVQTVLEELAEKHSDRIELLPVVNPATPDAIDEILEQEPHIFHFIGHGRLENEEGEKVGQIALVKEILNTASWVDAGFFGGLFNTHRPGVVLLQACETGMSSASQAFVGVASKIVQQNVPVVVAMQYEIINATALQFSCKFYERLAKENPVDIAAQNGRRTLALDSQYRNRSFATPVVFMRVQDGYLFRRQSSEVGAEAPSNKPQRITQALGNRSVAIGGNADGAIIIPGDGNTVQRVNQMGKYNVNIGKAENLRIGDGAQEN
jgi:CHAT domain